MCVYVYIRTHWRAFFLLFLRASALSLSLLTLDFMHTHINAHPI